MSDDSTIEDKVRDLLWENLGNVLTEQLIEQLIRLIDENGANEQ